MALINVPTSFVKILYSSLWDIQVREVYNNNVMGKYYVDNGLRKGTIATKLIGTLVQMLNGIPPQCRYYVENSNSHI